jgi:hypothetical protein
VVKDDPSSGHCVVGQGCTFPAQDQILIAQCPAGIGCEEGFCTSRAERLARNGQPCPGDPCKVNNVWRGEHCIGQIMTCSTPPCSHDTCNFIGPVDEADVLTVDTPQGSYQVAANRIALRVDPATAPSTVAAFASARLGGGIVSQFIDKGHYGIQVNAATKEEIDVKVADALRAPTIALQAFHASMPEYYGKCLHWTANASFELNSPVNCTWSDTEFPQAFHLFHELRQFLPEVAPAMLDTEVNVAVVDTGFHAEMVQPGMPFDLIHASDRLFAINGGEFGVGTETAHGTMVTSLIAADSHPNGLMQGIASSFMGQSLYVGVAINRHSTEDALDAIGDAASWANIINMSWGIAPWNMAVFELVDEFREYARDNPEVLFVVAAPNSGIGKRNTSFAGVIEPNVLAVNKTARCDLSNLHAGALHWDANEVFPGHLVAAPSQDVPVAEPNYGYAVEADGGTSLAAPQVTALAAILKWIDPDMSASRIRDYLTLNAPYGPPVIAVAKDSFNTPGHSYPVINHYRAIMERLLHLSSAGSEINRILSCEHTNTTCASDFPNNLDWSGFAFGRVCGERVDFVPAGYAPVRYQAANASTVEYGKMVATVTGWMLQARLASGVYMSVTNLADPFELGTYYFTTDYPPPSRTVGVDYVEDDTAVFSPFGSGLDGEVEITECQINSRYGTVYAGAANEPAIGLVEGTIRGNLHVLDENGIEVDGPIIEGRFRVPLLHWGCYLDPSGCAYLDSLCYGGRMR